MNDFRDKVVVITGASEGVGAAAARAYARAGAKLMLVARTRKNLEKITEELRPQTDVRFIAMDVSDNEACINLFKKVMFEFSALHVLVNNAGYHQRGPAESVDAEDLGRMIDVNLRAPIVLSRLAIPYLRETEGPGAIINVASLAGRTPVTGAATYSASKFGLRAFSFALAEELADTNIKIGVVSPGPIDTGFIMSNIDDVADITFSQPMSTADEVAEVILELCDDKRREVSMPRVSGWLTMVSYLFPTISRRLQPALDKRGREVKRALKQQMARELREQKQ